MEIELVVRLERGRQKDRELTRSILFALEQLRMAYPEHVRREVSRQLNRQISWNTVKAHLEDLVGEGLANKLIVSKNEREIAVYTALILLSILSILYLSINYVIITITMF